ncbi:MAG TPA: imidazoleglycerol-phosphate dehydratase HisB [Nitrospirae bacterium]|nr:imidazoleglycerol-phosphate dehydratase [bacterium BMS3Abin06]HDH12947.1 imidazoleglycerol-phosphate dehydratase HisB [Nitrospirota bacterium]HDZ00435.1 imidazoleglycerol-phosphate dehydratase HisB [Nitrospirota bacterium]
MARKAKVVRKTKETDIRLGINLDGKGDYRINTSIPFVDHMLTLMSMHGQIDLDVQAKGDIEVDYHHLMEDIGIVLGEAINKALGRKLQIRRYGESMTPMDESLAQVVIDLSGRPYLVYNVRTPRGSAQIQSLGVSLFEDFFRALSNNAGMNLHIILQYGRDPHHIFEAIFKGLGRALRSAVEIQTKTKGIPSTKGTL